MSKIGNFFRKRLTTIINLGISLFLLLVAGGTGVYVAFAETYSADKYMDEFYECFLNESYAALFKSAGVEESKFISTTAFTQMMVNDYGYEETEKYSIGKVVQSGNYAKATVAFVDSETIETVKWDLKLEKSKDKKYVFFNEWQVNIDDFIIEDVKITAPEEVEVIIDDINITTEDIEEVDKTVDQETGKVTYTIGRMFKGTHAVLFVGKHTEPESYITTFDEEHKLYSCRNGVLVSSHKDMMSGVAKNIIVEMYNSAFTGAGTTQLLTMFAATEEVSGIVDSKYKAMVDAINKDDGTTLISIDITDYSIMFDRYNFDEKTVAKFYYTASYTAKSERTLNDGVRDTYEGTVTAEAYVTFEFVDEKWQAVNIEMECIDYSKPEEE